MENNTIFLNCIKNAKSNGDVIKIIQKFYSLYSYEDFKKYVYENFNKTQKFYEISYQEIYIAENEDDNVTLSFKVNKTNFYKWRNNKRNLSNREKKIFSRIFQIPYDFWFDSQKSQKSNDDKIIVQLSEKNHHKNILNIVFEHFNFTQNQFVEEVNFYIENNNYQNIKPMDRRRFSNILKNDNIKLPKKYQTVIQDMLEQNYPNLCNNIWNSENNPQLFDLTYKTAEDYYQAAKIYCEHSNFDKALEILLKAENLYPDFCNYYKLKHYIYSKNGNYPKTIIETKNYQNCNEKKELLTNFEDYRKLALSNFENDFEKSYYNFLKAINLQPNIFFDYHNILELCLLHNKPFDKEIEKVFYYFFKHIKRDPDALVIYDLLKMIYDIQNENILHKNYSNIEHKLKNWHEANSDAWIGKWSISSLYNANYDDLKQGKHIRNLIDQAKRFRNEIIL